MASETKRSPVLDQRKSLELVDEWLHVESLARPARRNGLHPNNAYALSRVVLKEISQKWETMHDYKDKLFGEEPLAEVTSLTIGRLVLQSASLAQHGFVLGKITRKENIFTAVEDSWHEIQGFKQHFRYGKVRLPQMQNFELPADRAIEQYTGQKYGNFKHTYIGMVAYSASMAIHLMDGKDFVLPTPGVSEDILQRWDYDPS